MRGLCVVNELSVCYDVLSIAYHRNIISNLMKCSYIIGEVSLSTSGTVVALSLHC